MGEFSESRVEPADALGVEQYKEMAMSIVADAVAKVTLARELLQFFWHNKWWWLAPMVVLLLAFGVLIILAESSAIAPFIYTLF